MIVCSFCNSKNIKHELKSVMRPEHDLFSCLDCKKKFYRYQNTEYEREGDTRFNN